MKLEQSFEVEMPLDQVWEALVDVERVAPCLPGAAVTGRNEDGSYNGTFTIKIGPTTASYAGKLEMRDVDEAAHTAKMLAQGADRRGQGGATATIESTLSPHNGGTRVDVVTDYHITGRLARFGRGGMIEDISHRLLREFAGRLQSTLSEDQPTTEQPRVAAELDPRAEAGSAGDDAPGPEATPAPTEAVGPPPPAAQAQAGAPPAPPGAAPPPPHDSEAVPPSPPPPPGAAPPRSPEAAAPPPPPPGASAQQPVEPLAAGPIVGSVMLDRVKRNPLPVMAVVGGLVVIGLLRRRR